MGFQLGDWCWFCEQRGCRSVDFDWCALGLNFWVQNYGFDFWVRFLVSISDCRFVDVDYCLIWVLNFNVFGCKENTRKIKKRKENKTRIKLRRTCKIMFWERTQRTWTCSSEKLTKRKECELGLLFSYFLFLIFLFS